MLPMDDIVAWIQALEAALGLHPSLWMKSTKHTAQAAEDSLQLVLQLLK